MTKNVKVFDEQDNFYGETYPKRAKGLVKNGRARYVGESSICLACPPNIDLEDVMEEILDIKEQPGGQIKEQPQMPTMKYVLERIDKIVNDTAHIREAITAVKEMEINGGISGDEARGNAISTAVQARETTNQQALRLYEKMYDDLKPKNKSLQEKAMDIVECTFAGEERENLLSLFEAIRHIEN